MSTVAKLKKKAIEFEQRKQFDKALAEYRKVLDELGDSVDEADVALFNRVGDLELRQGNVSRALDHYERAVDLYCEGGFFNNAIALCNKILRNAPGRASIYYKLGMISARKGFVNDAKQNFLEYADRMQQAGQMEEAFRALREFADLCPDQDDIRLMLADQLVRKDRKGEAIEQLQTLYEKLQAEGRSREARATVERMRAIDPDMEPRAGTFKPTPKSSDLIFLDINYDGPAGAGGAGGRSARASGAAARRDESPADRAPAPEPVPNAGVPDERMPDADLPLVEADLDGGTEPLAGLVHGASLDSSGAPDDTLQGASIPGLERTILGSDDVARPHDDGGAGPLEGLELTSLSGGELDDDLGIALDDAGAFPGLRGGDTPDDSGELPGLDAFSDDRPLAGGYELPSVDDTLSPEEETSLGMDLPLLDVPDAQDESTSIGDTLSFIDTSDDSAGMLGLASGEEESPLFSGDADEISLRPRANVSIEIQREQAGLLEFDEEPEAPAEIVSDPAARRVAELQRAVANEPEKWLLHRELGEALLEAGERDGGMGQLELAMTGFEGDGDFRSARAIAEEILRLDPSSVHYHQKRVEYAFRANDKAHLVDAYLELADCLFRSGDVDKSRAVYRRVLELSPDHRRALDALGVFAPVRSATPDEQFVNLADWLREEDTPRSTRMVADVAHRATDEQVGFAEMLSMFKQGVAANMDEGDYDSHYDLGVAYKEMGLLDEAIAEFQKALRGTEHRVRTCEALGQCFIEKEQYQVAITVLSRALNERSHGDDTLVGVLYLLGTASEALGRWQDAIQHYERVFALDIQFRDVSQRLAALERQVQ